MKRSPGRKLDAEAVLWAEAKLGELLKPLTEHHEARSGGGTSSLPDGITKKQSHEAQQLFLFMFL